MKEDEPLSKIHQLSLSVDNLSGQVCNYASSQAKHDVPDLESNDSPLHSEHDTSAEAINNLRVKNCSNISSSMKHLEPFQNVTDSAEIASTSAMNTPIDYTITQLHAHVSNYLKCA